MQSEQQFEQLILQYQQLLNGAEEIAKMIEKEDFDSAITLLRSREQLFMNCKCMRRYLELTQIQQKQLDKILDEIRNSELKNIKALEKGMDNIQLELSKTQKSQKLQQAYGAFGEGSNGNLVNFED